MNQKKKKKKKKSCMCVSMHLCMDGCVCVCLLQIGSDDATAGNDAVYIVWVFVWITIGIIDNTDNITIVWCVIDFDVYAFIELKLVIRSWKKTGSLTSVCMCMCVCMYVCMCVFM